METKKDQPGTFTLFVRQCMLFGSRDPLYRFFGVFVWIDLVVMIYAIIKVIHPA